MSGDLIYQYHEEPPLRLYIADDDMFLVPLKYVDVMKLTETINDVSHILSMVYRPKRRVSIFLRSGLELQDSRSHVRGVQEDKSRYTEDQRKSTKDYQT